MTKVSDIPENYKESDEYKEWKIWITKEKAKAKSITIVSGFKVGTFGHYNLIVRDTGSGMPNRYTVYRIPSSPSGRVRIIGRELPLKFAKKLASERK